MILSLFNIVYFFVWTCVLPVLVILATTLIPKWKPGLRERLGNLDPEDFPRYNQQLNRFAKPIWFHAVSVGELNALLPLLRLFYGVPLVLSTTTNAAHKLALQKLNKEISDKQIKLIYMPWDHPWIINKVIDRIQPLAVILMESEIWPSLINIANRKQIFLAIINAKISDSSFRFYKFLLPIFRPILQKINLILAQSPQHSRKYIDLGLNKNQIFMTGNLKFAIKYDLNPAKAKQIRKSIGYEEADCIWVAASTHEEEEANIISIFQELQLIYPNFKLIIAPRHPERFTVVFDLINAAAKLNPKRLSTFKTAMLKSNLREPLLGSNNDILLVDSIGDLLDIFSFADIAFVGGTLIERVGGHNVLEPAACNLPVLVGPYYHKNTEMFQSLEQGGGLFIAESKEELKDALIKLISDPDARVLMGANGKSLVKANQKIINVVEQKLKTALSARLKS
jgi:3-deoxy-D-manno-octulosonic-acid transferase